MPVGNGDAAALVWCAVVSQNNTVVKVLLSKSDAFDENHNLLKIGTVRVTLQRWMGSRCMLHLANSTVEVEVEMCKIIVSVDTAVNIVRVSARGTGGGSCGTLHVAAQGLRQSKKKIPSQWERAYCDQKHTSADVVTASGDDGMLSWEHRNGGSTVVGDSMKSQGGFVSGADPLSGKVFGALVECEPKCEKDPNVTLGLRTVMTGLPQEIVIHLVGSRPNEGKLKWQWNEFWSRSFFQTNIPQLTSAYLHQRYLTAIQAYGQLPVKFNGGLFTLSDDRRWGGLYWWQNTRLAYLPALFNGDHDQLESLYHMYESFLPLAMERCEKFFNLKKCAYFVETATVGGTMADGAWGYGCSAQRVGLPPWMALNPFTRHEHQMGLELLQMMLDHMSFQGHDDKHLLVRYQKLFTPVINFYKHRYPRVSNKVRIHPANGLETYQSEDVEDPVPEIAALRVLLSSAKMDLSWVPDIPLRDGVLQPAKTFGERKNQENVALYAVHPYRLHLRGMVSVSVARATYHRRPYHCNVGWCQDIMDAALLGIWEDVEKMAFDRVKKGTLPEWQYPYFAPAFQDEAPNQEHFPVLSTALQFAILQWSDGSPTLSLLPAWPCHWDLHVKMHAPNRTVIELGYRQKDGVWLLKVSPGERLRNVVVVRCV